MPISDSASPAPPSGASARLPRLDALRAMAAACVVIMHCGAIYQSSPRLLGPAYLAVDFFFLLSGFVMARTYEARLRDGRIDTRRFVAARYRRLWPTMAVGAVLSLPFVWRDSESLAVVAKVAIPNFFLWPTLAAPEIFPLNVPAWSIFFELLANLVHGAVLHRLGKRALALLIAAFLVALLLCGQHFGNLDLGARKATLVGGLARVGFAYTLGIVLWRLHGDRAPLTVPPLLALAAMPLLFTAATWHGWDSWRFDLLFVVIACPLMLWGGLGASGLRAPQLQALALHAGALSFPLYAVHYPVLLAAEATGISRHLAPLLALACAMAAQAAVHRLEHILKAKGTL